MPDFLYNIGIPITWKQFERYWFIFSLSVIIISLPFSKIGLSIGQMMMAGGWMVERFNVKKFLDGLGKLPAAIAGLVFLPYAVLILFQGVADGFRQFFRNKAAVVFSSIFLLHLLGLLTTTDFDYAFKDLRTKIPLVLLPLFLSTAAPFDKKAFFRLLVLFGAALVFRTVYNSWLIYNGHYIDIRDVAHNVSHIILSLLIAVVIFSQIYLSLRKEFFSSWIRFLLAASVLWFLFYLVYSQSFTGISIVVITFLVFLMVVAFRSMKVWKRAGVALFIVASSAAIVLSLRSIITDFYRVNPVDFKKLEQFSRRGNPYINDSLARQTENGNYLWIYVQMEEMRDVWNRRSTIPFDSLNKKNEICAFTVIRFLASKGWRKDADAVERLTTKEIRAIEKGVPNYLFVDQVGLRARIYEFLWGFETYRQTGNPTGSTIMQRLEFWKASAGIIRDNWLTGVGTGDMNAAFSVQYDKMHTMLSPEQRWRSHNQFLSVFIGFGIFGLVWFLIALFAPPRILHFNKDYFMTIFMIIAVLSMITEDTIESQTGVTFFAFFYAFFLFSRKEQDYL